MGNRFLGFIIAFVVMCAVFSVTLKKYGSTESTTAKRTGKKYSYPQGVVVRLPSQGEWIRPKGDAESLAEELTVDELIDRWNRWPAKSGKESYQSLYAEALGLYGEEAAAAVPELSKAVKHFEPNLRRKVMHALVAIGEEGIPPLLEALVFKTTEKDTSFTVVHISEDAASSLAQAARNKLDLADTVPVLREFLADPETSVFARQNVAQVLSYISTPESEEALENARNGLYEQNGLSVEENRILSIVNSGLRGSKARS